MPATLNVAKRADATRLGFARFALLLSALFAASALPVLLCGTLPLFDYPNHLARMHILASLPDSAALQNFYAITWRPLPNLAMDLIVPPLAHLMPLAWAGKVFVLLTLLALAGGVAVLHRVIFGAWSAWSLLAFLFLYNRILLWGFLNFLFGVGLGLLALALWIALGRRRRALRLALGTLSALALFFAHLLAFGLYGAMVMGYEAGEVLRLRPGPRVALANLAAAALTFVPALAILAFATPGAASGAIAWAHLARKLDLLFSVFDNYNRPFDLGCFALLVLGLAMAYGRRWVRLDASMVAPLAVLAAVYLVMPSRLATGSGADHRIPLVIALLLVAGSRWTGPHERSRQLFLGAALALFLVRLGVVTASWQASDRVYAALLPAIDALPVGSRIAVAYSPESINSEATPLAHFPALAIIRRDAFVPTLFAFPTQQPVALRPPYQDLARRLPPERLWEGCMSGKVPLGGEERAALNRYDFVAFVARRPFAEDALARLDPVFTSPRFAIARVAPGETCSGVRN